MAPSVCGDDFCKQEKILSGEALEVKSGNQEEDEEAIDGRKDDARRKLQKKECGRGR